MKKYKQIKWFDQLFKVNDFMRENRVVDVTIMKNTSSEWYEYDYFVTYYVGGEEE